MTEYLSLESAYSTLIDYNNNFLEMMDIPLEPEREYRDEAADGCVMRMAKSDTPSTPHLQLLALNDPAPKHVTTLVYQSRLSPAFNAACRHNRLMVVTGGRFECQQIDGEPVMDAGIGHLTLQRVRPKRDGKQLPYPIIRATVGHDIIRRNRSTVRYGVRPDQPEAVNIQTMDELHSLLGWVTLKIQEAGEHSQFRDATHYAEDYSYYNKY